ncbi:MAG: glutaredoxin family protein [Micromonosporaceae bacterium]
MNRLVLLTRPGCGLCGPAREAMARVSETSGVPWQEVDVTTDLDLEREYGDRLPVVLLDGTEHGYWRVEEDRLLRDLTR